MSELALITPPAVTVVSVDDAKEYLRIDNDLEDGRIETMIKAATRKLESYTGVAFITQTWDVFLDCFPMQTMKGPWWEGVRDGAIGDVFSKSQNIVLPIGRAQALVQFSTYGDDNVDVPATPSDFITDTVGNRARVGLKTGGVWPQTVLRSNNGIRFRLRCGFGDTPSTVPDDIKEAVLEYVAHMYENRGDQSRMTTTPHIFEMVDHYRRNKVG